MTEENTEQNVCTVESIVQLNTVLYILHSIIGHNQCQSGAVSLVDHLRTLRDADAMVGASDFRKTSGNQNVYYGLVHSNSSKVRRSTNKFVTGLDQCTFHSAGDGAHLLGAFEHRIWYQRVSHKRKTGVNSDFFCSSRFRLVRLIR